MTQKNELRKWPSVGRTQKITLADCLGRSFINIYGGFLSHDGVPHDLSSISNDGISHDINFHFGIPPFMETRIYIHIYIYMYIHISAWWPTPLSSQGYARLRRFFVHGWLDPPFMTELSGCTYEASKAHESMGILWNPKMEVRSYHVWPNFVGYMN